MKFPQIPTCHGSEAYNTKAAWRKPHIDGEPYAESFRTCFYCGSICPEDLVSLSKDHLLTFDQADWKYGYPHKMYIEGVPNLNAGKRVRIGTNADGSPMMGEASKFCYPNFYTEHLKDEGYDDEAFAAITNLLKRTGIKFYKDAEGKLMYANGYYNSMK